MLKALRTLFGLPVEGRSICISMVRNEQDIIEPFLRHNRRFFDEMFVLDHSSSDRTAEIIRACAEELGHIHLGTVAEVAQNQGAQVTAVLHRESRRLRPEFVALMDADEFIDAPDRAAWEAELRRIPKGGAGRIGWQTYLPGAEADDPVLRMSHRRAEELPLSYKVVLRLKRARSDGIVVRQGNHQARRRNGGKLPRVVLDLTYMHLPVRSREQLISKCSTGYLADSLRPDRVANQATQWQEIGRQVIEDGVPFAAIEVDLAQEALRYAQDEPVPAWPANTVPARPSIRYERRHSDGSFADPALLIGEALKRAGR